MSKITWLASYPKSGNTWARLVVSAYSSDSPPDINRIQSVWGDTKEYYYEAVAPCALTALNDEEQLLLRPTALLHLTRAVNATPFVVKTHFAQLDADGTTLIPWALTERAIYISRDPRDVVISLAEHMGMGLDEAIAMLNDPRSVIGRVPGELLNVITSWSLHAKSWLAAPKPFPVTLMRYEDMLRDPKAKLGSFLDRIGLDVIEDRLERAISRTAFHQLRQQEDAEGFLETSDHADRFFVRGTAGHWRTTLTEPQVLQIESSHAEAMVELGYEPEIYNYRRDRWYEACCERETRPDSPAGWRKPLVQAERDSDGGEGGGGGDPRPRVVAGGRT